MPEQDELAPETLDTLRRVSTATLSLQLLARGFRSTFVAGLAPTRPDLRLVGRAYTLRYAPAREDVAFQTTFDNERNLQRRAIESVGAGEVLVIDARGDGRAGVCGDILATRVWRRGAAGIVTDGCFRDAPGFAAIEMPCYARGAHANVSSTVHHPVDLQVPVGCGGVLVVPGDVLVGDAEGVIVIPASLVDEVAADAAEQERREEFALERVRAGESIGDLYPLAETRRSDYEAWRAARGAP